MHSENALGHAQSGTGSPVDFSGNWTNELGSVASLVQTGNTLTGVYTSAVSEGEGSSTTSGPLSGYVDGNLISFVVHWDQFQSITAWVGQLLPASGQITTLWQMTSAVDPGEEWASINAGTDTFTRSA